MPERGGATTQSGIYYHNSVAAQYLGRLLDTRSRPPRDRVVAVRVEALGALDDTVATFADDHRAYIQAKEVLRPRGDIWERLWQSFAAQYAHANFHREQDRLVLYTGDARDEYLDLREASERTTATVSYMEWSGRLTVRQRRLIERITTSLPQELREGDARLAFFGHVDVEIAQLSSIEYDIVRWMPPTAEPALTIFSLLRDRCGGQAHRRGSFNAGNCSGTASLGVRARFPHGESNDGKAPWRAQCPTAGESGPFRPISPGSAHLASSHIPSPCGIEYLNSYQR